MPYFDPFVHSYSLSQSPQNRTIMGDQAKAEFFALARASIESCRSGGKTDSANHAGTLGASSDYSQQANWASSETLSSVAAKKPVVEVTEHEVAPGVSEANSRRRGIDWRSPATMFVTFFIGLLAAGGQHFYYFSLAGDLVGCTDAQQRVLRLVSSPCPNLDAFMAASVDRCTWQHSLLAKHNALFLTYFYRFGTTFAFVTQVSLAASVAVAATQCLWRSLRRANLSLSTIDAAFDSHNNMVTFLNLQLFTKLKVATFLALVAW